MKVKIVGTGFSDSELAKLNAAGALLEQVLNSDDFKSQVKYFSYPYTAGSLWWKKTYIAKEFRWNNGKSNQQVLDSILAGDELQAGHPDSELDCDITIYLGDPGVLGYTYPNSIKTWINRSFFSSSPVNEIAGNIAHEYCHKIGFDHEFNYTSLREFTVPYAIGYMVARLAAKLMNQLPSPAAPAPTPAAAIEMG